MLELLRKRQDLQIGSIQLHVCVIHSQLIIKSRGNQRIFVLSICSSADFRSTIMPEVTLGLIPTWALHEKRLHSCPRHHCSEPMVTFLALGSTSPLYLLVVVQLRQQQTYSPIPVSSQTALAPALNWPQSIGTSCWVTASHVAFCCILLRFTDVMQLRQPLHSTFYWFSNRCIKRAHPPLDHLMHSMYGFKTVIYSFSYVHFRPCNLLLSPIIRTVLIKYCAPYSSFSSTI